MLCCEVTGQFEVYVSCLPVTFRSDKVSPGPNQEKESRKDETPAKDGAQMRLPKLDRDQGNTDDGNVNKTGVEKASGNVASISFTNMYPNDKK